jgi:enhancing lycopene biosynthesis protein 2
MKKIGILLSGCGFLDGSEIHEAVLTLLAIDRAGAEAVCLAPDITHFHVINHYNGEAMPNESRNILVESARIARGSIKDLKEIDTLTLDALILPGGYGAAKNLSTYAFKGPSCDVNADVAAAVQSFYTAGKPLGFICIAPVIAARILGKENIELTIGNDPQTAADIEAMGARHIDGSAWNAIVCREKKVVSTPAYMMDATISEVARGIEKLVGELLTLL